MKFLLPTGVFLAVFFVDLLMRTFPALPSSFKYLPDLSIAVSGAFAIAKIVLTGRVGLIPLRYWLLFLGFSYVAISAVVVNDVSPDVTIGGIRFYFRYVPLFLLPFAFDYSDKDLRRLFVLFVTLALVQIPVAFKQRFVEYTKERSGDLITGTLSLSTSLTLFCVGMIIVVLALYVDKRLSIRVAAPLGLLFLLPAAINETKVTPIALGIGAAAILLARGRRLKPSQFLILSLSGALLLGVFVGVYDHLYKRDGSGGYLDFITSPKDVLDGYSLRGVTAKNFELARDSQLVANPVRLTEQATWIGRLDSVTMAFSILNRQDLPHLIFGLGIGSISSDFGTGGQYRYLSNELGATMTTVTQTLWETGLSGTFLSLLLVVCFTRDAWKGSRSQAMSGSFCLAFFGICCAVLLTLLYANYVLLYEATCLIAFFSAVAVRRSDDILRASASGQMGYSRDNLSSRGSRHYTRDTGGQVQTRRAKGYVR